ncbi:thiol reductant ABC exporter subunit CydD [Paenibacillus thalictri]|uniref:Thiol reductant ABC exporter subunit CydD n=1 Tax=Paenibacillus thalictri TaxID=2527873 RepID=A0A4Q9DGN5_9BACL|nr:thiol reductant ABC exporter subunit CydD [Paenibacillus thalictri]TBL69912.1 thiol reductant ABC exporter subunit CydD [Paenibacillus thalictri]
MKRKSGLLRSQISELRICLAWLGVLSLALGAAIVGQAALFAEIVERILAEGAVFQGIFAPLAALAAVMTLRVLLSHGNGRLGLHMAAEAKTSLRAKVLRKLTGGTLQAALDGRAGGKVSLTLDAVDEADSYFSQYVPRMMETVLIPPILLVAVFTQHAFSGLIMLLTAPFIPIFMVLIGMQTRKKSEDKVEQLAVFSGTFLDSLQGLATLKLFGRTEERQREIERSSLGFRDATMGILRVAFTNSLMLELIVMLSIGLLALELALRLLVYRSLAFGPAFFILLLAPEFYSLLKNMGTAFHSGRTAMGAVRKVEELLEESAMGQENEAVDSGASPRDAEVRYGGTSRPERSGQAGFPADEMAWNREPPLIELRQLCFRYKPGGFALAADTASIAPRSRVAIVGSSGSGKTTLLHLIAGLLRPLSGAVLVNGRPLADYAEETWYRHIGYITQHPYIFAGTFAENVAIGADREVSRAEIADAVGQAELTGLAAEWEYGYDTMVGEGGRGLSGGEKQRLALARAFLKRPSVILFDEPTVGLDLSTERILQRSMDELAKQATMITVAHRLYTIRHADLILYMENGVLLDSGRHEELMRRLPQYAEMVEVQRKGGLQ